MVFSDGPLPKAVQGLMEHGVAVLDVEPGADTLGQARARYGLAGPADTALVLVRPDGYADGPLARAGRRR